MTITPTVNDPDGFSSHHWAINSSEQLPYIKLIALEHYGVSFVAPSSKVPLNFNLTLTVYDEEGGSTQTDTRIKINAGARGSDLMFANKGLAKCVNRLAARHNQRLVASFWFLSCSNVANLQQKLGIDIKLSRCNP